MKCPYCLEEIIDGAKVCRFCGKDQPGAKAAKVRQRDATIVKVAGLILGGVILLAVIGRLLGPVDAGASCDRQFGAGTDGASQCRIEQFLSREREKQREALAETITGAGLAPPPAKLP